MGTLTDGIDDPQVRADKKRLDRLVGAPAIKRAKLMPAKSTKAFPIRNKNDS